MALFKVYHAVDEDDLPASRVQGNSYIIDNEEKDFLQWKVDVGANAGDRKGIASEGLIYEDGDMKTPDAITPSAFPSIVLTTSGWVIGAENMTQTVTVPGLKCGKNGDMPPIIQCTYNKDDYYKLSDAIADGETITFTMDGTTRPESRIELTIIDF